jgi:hypothetical protein
VSNHAESYLEVDLPQKRGKFLQALFIFFDIFSDLQKRVNGSTTALRDELSAFIVHNVSHKLQIE